MISEPNKEAEDGTLPEIELEIGVYRLISAARVSQPMIKALYAGHVQRAIRHLADAELQLEGQGRVLDFSQCQGVVSEVRSAYRRCLEGGLESQAKALERSFERYFAMRGTETDE